MARIRAGLATSMALAALLPGVATGAQAKGVELVWATARAISRVNSDTVKAFEAANPGITVKISNYIWDWPEKLLTAAAGGKAPDVAQGFGDQWRGLIDANLFLPVDPYVKQAGFPLDAFNPQHLRCWKKGGKLYSLPMYAFTLATVYNQSLLDQNGIAKPAADWTWDDLLDMARKLTKVDDSGKVKYWGVAMGQEFDIITRSHGGDTVPSNQIVANKLLYDQPVPLQAMQYVHDLIWKYKACPVNADLQYDMAKKAAIAITGSHGLKFWMKADKSTRYGTVEVPSGPAGKASIYPLDGYAVMRSTKHPAEAMRFLMFLSGPEASKIRSTEDEFLQPARLDQLESWKRDNPFGAIGLDVTPFVKATAYSRPVAQYANDRVVNDNWGPMLDKVFARNQAPLRESVIATVARINQQLAKYPAVTE